MFLCASTECFPEKSRWRWNEQVCQAVEYKTLCVVTWNGYNAIQECIFYTLPYSYVLCVHFVYTTHGTCLGYKITLIGQLSVYIMTSHITEEFYAN